MSDILNFVFSEASPASHSADEDPSPHERIARCSEIAAQVEHLVASAANKLPRGYIELARQLRAFADEMERAAS